MRSARSWFNFTLYKKNLTRFWPIWGLYLVIWLFVLPINLVLDNYGDPFRFAHWQVLNQIKNLGLPLAVVFALMAACAVWFYLCNNRAACLMHTLPIRREGLFLTNFLSGMTFLIGPNLIVFVLTLLAEAARGEVAAGPLVMWLVSVSLLELAFFCFATFCAMFTGHVLGLPAFYVILNALAAGLVCLLDLTLSRFVFGYTGIEGVWSAAEWLTPVWKLGENLTVRMEYVNDMPAYETAWLSGLGYILVYAILGLILAALALAVYRRRDMERAGDVVTVSWVRPIFQYGVAFCCALAFGSLLYEIFCGTLQEGAWTLLVFMLICGAAGYFLARMLLEKSFRVFRYWKGCVPFLAALVVLVCVMEFDLTGFERRVPDEEDVEKVTISNIYTAPYDDGRFLNMEVSDPEVICAVLEAHRTIVENKDFIENEAYDGAWETTDEGYSIQTRDYTGFNVTYYLEDGKKVSRDYTVPVLAENLDDSNSLTAKLDALVNLPQAIGEVYGLADKSPDNIIEMTLTSYRADDYGYDGYDTVAISKDAYEKVYRAVMADFAEGNLGRRYLMENEERMNNCFVNDLEINFYLPDAAALQEAGSAGVTAPTTQSITVTLQTTAAHTLAALKETGVLAGEVGLLTHAQMETARRAWSENGQSWTGIDLKDFAWTTLGE